MRVIFLMLLVVISYTDMKRRQISNWCCLCIVALAVISDAVFFAGHFGHAGSGIGDEVRMELEGRIIGAVCVSVPMLGIAVMVPGSFGGGDAKLMCSAGLLLGWRRILWSSAAGILAAGVYALYLLTIKNTGRKAEFPLGPFLCLGMAVNMLAEIY